MTLAQGFEHSINSVFCNVGMKIGAATILEYAKKFGFYSTPPLETPANERAPSGLYYNGKLEYPKHPDTAVDPGRLAFGQEHLAVTPLQMLLVASTIANGGVVPRPYLVQRIIGPDGSTVRTTRPDNLGRAIKTQTAAELTQMMISVVQGGTGTAAQIPGIQVAGKTGTAETCCQRRLHRLVRLLRARRRPAGRRRRRAREAAERIRRRGGRPHRQTDAAEAPAWLRLPVPSRDSRGRFRHAHRHALRRALPGRAQARRRRDGERLPRRGPGARPPRRDQDPERAARERRAVRRALPPRGQERRRALAGEHRLDLRPRRGRGDVLHRHGVPRRPLAEGADRRQRPGAGRRRHRVRAADPQGAPVRAPEGHRPPRHQAAQRARRLRRPREGDGLRDRARRAPAR